MLKSPRFRKQAGLSLLEVLIAALVLSTGLLGLASLQIAGMKTTHNSYQMQQATWMVHDLLERMRANRAEVFRKAADDSPASGYLINTTSIAHCVTANEPAVDCATVTCTGAELASYDIYRLMCGYGGSSGIANTLMDGQLAITCTAGDCAAGGVNVNLQWNERNATQAAADLDGVDDGLDAFNINLNVSL